MGFAIKSRLGRGRSVDTFAARLDVEGEAFDVVVKRPRAEFRDNQAFASAFVAWGEAQQSVEHESLVAVLEAGTTEDGPYVLQEMVEGAPLSVVVAMLRRRKRSLTANLALSIAAHAATALKHLHAEGIVHGGLDPGEVLLSYDGEVKLGDQRLRALDQHLGTDLVEESDTTYLAPEARADAGQATEASDVYALGLVVLEMLIGSAVWKAESMSVAGSVAALRDFTHVGQADPSFTEDLVGLLEGMLAEAPDQRTTAASALEKLKAIVAKHGAREDAATLGGFVQALVPRPEGEDAPTMMLDPAKAEELAAQQKARLAQFDLQSVAVDPDVEKKALTRAAPALLVGRSATPEPRAPSKEGSAPLAPSVARSRAHSVPDVAKVAAKASTELDEKTGRVVKITALVLGGIIILGLALSIFGGDSYREVQLYASSIPPGATLFVDDMEIGGTPVEQPIQVKGSTVKLRFEMEGYRDHEVSIGTEADELRYEASLKATE